jgi:Protein-disulfide isomerase
MKPLKLSTLLSIALIAVAGAESSMAADLPASPETVAKLQALYPKTHFNAVKPSQIPGLTEVVMGDNVAYVDESGRYFLFGHLYDMKAGKDLTPVISGAGRSAAAPIDFAALPLKDAIVNVQGNGSRRLAVFSDPDCPYCKRLSATLADLKDVTIYTFLLPLEELHPEARSKALAVWCASDRSAAWLALMAHRVVPHSKACADDPLARNAKLAKRLGVNGTPSLFAADGRRQAGALPLDQLEAFVAGSVVGVKEAAK